MTAPPTSDITIDTIAATTALAQARTMNDLDQALPLLTTPNTKPHHHHNRQRIDCRHRPDPS